MWLYKLYILVFRMCTYENRQRKLGINSQKISNDWLKQQLNRKIELKKYQCIDQGRFYGTEKIVDTFSWSFWASWIQRQGASSAPDLAWIPDTSCRISSLRTNMAGFRTICCCSSETRHGMWIRRRKKEFEIRGCFLYFNDFPWISQILDFRIFTCEAGLRV